MPAHDGRTDGRTDTFLSQRPEKFTGGGRAPEGCFISVLDLQYICFQQLARWRHTSGGIVCLASKFNLKFVRQMTPLLADISLAGGLVINTVALSERSFLLLR